MAWINLPFWMEGGVKGLKGLAMVKSKIMEATIQRRKGGEDMLKRSMFIGVVVFGLMALLQAQAMAAYILPSNQAVSGCAWKLKPNGKWDYCCYRTCRGSCYWFQWVVTGGSNPHDEIGYLLATGGTVFDYALVCKNPKGFDVRLGKGWLTFTANTPLNSNYLTQSTNGKTIATTDLLCERIDEIVGTADNPVKCADSPPASLTGPSSLEAGPSLFEQTWGVSSNDCRNTNGSPYAFEILSLQLRGTLYNNCLLSATGPDGCDDVDPRVGAAVHCETKTPARTEWVYGDEACDPSTDPYCICDEVTDPDGNRRTICSNVSYLCVDSGLPIAYNDSYSVRPGGTLKVRDIGVLTNDHDTPDIITETDLTGSATFSTTLTVGSVFAWVGGVEMEVPLTDSSLTFSTQGGNEVTISSNGGFTATGVIGSDLFTYKAKDGYNNYSNSATVTITVK